MKINKNTIRDGYICSYWDISQAEPRSICYLSEDPLFKDLYQIGGDAYKELAIRRWLASHNLDPSFNSPDRAKVDMKWVKEQRTLYKTIILSGIYGRSIKALSESAGVSYEVGKEIWEGFMGPMKKVTEFRDNNIAYAEKNGYINTILGERIPCDMDNIYTTANNWAVQGFTAVILATFFYNCIEKALSMGIDVTSYMIIHDSQTISFPIKDLFLMDLICRKYFREACKQYFKPDYKFDWDLMFDLMKHIPYQFDLNSSTATFTLWSEKVDYLLDHLAVNYKFKVTQRDEFTEPDTEGAKLLVSTGKNKYHLVMENERFRQLKQTKLKIQLTEKLKNIDWWDVPLEPTFLEHIKKIKYLDFSKFSGETNVGISNAV